MGPARWRNTRYNGSLHAEEAVCSFGNDDKDGQTTAASKIASRFVRSGLRTHTTSAGQGLTRHGEASSFIRHPSSTTEPHPRSLDHTSCRSLRTTHILPPILLASSVAAEAIRGFNSGGIGPNGVKRAADFTKEFQRMHTLPGTPPFVSARLYTMIQAHTENDPVEAFQPAIDTNTRLLLGMWASAGQAAFNQELTALKKAIRAHPRLWKKIVFGLCVGSEDLYRITPTGIANQAGAGEGPEKLADYIRQTRDALRGTPAEGTPICHVDTWTAWVNASNHAVVDAVDWLGFDGYPYYEKDTGINSIDNARRLFQESLDKTTAVAKGKPVKITETGWPVSGPNDFGKSVASVENAERYWKDVGCSVFGTTDTWWFTLDDAKKTPAEISFSTIKPGFGDPYWDLSCPKK